MNTTYDPALRISGITGVKGGEPSKTYATNFLYAPHGGVEALKLGNELWENASYNERLQPFMTGLGTTNANSSLFKLDYSYGPLTSNNGNLLSQVISVGTATLTQNYTYDPLNRLKTAAEGSNWSQTYEYDRYGNRCVTPASYIQASALTPQALSHFNASNNRLVSSGYDLAGNLTTDATTRTFTYDAENRQTSVTTPGQGTVSYSYDGEGRRVKKTQASQDTFFVYDALGQLAAEFSVQGPQGPGGTLYLTADHLGSTRVVTDASRVVKARHDYLPFGEDIPASIGRAAIAGYGGIDGLRQKFTAKERDTESGLDYFGARYFSGAQGRFTSSDPFNPVDELVGQEFDDYLAQPQYWNRYAYSLNNPLKYKDSDGHLPHAVVGALVGGSIGGALELYSQIRSGQDVNWAKVATKTGVGAAVGATAAATFGGSLVVQGFSLGLVNAGAGIADRALDNDASTQALDETAIVADTIVGGVAGVVGGVLGKQIQTGVQNSAGQKLNERLADHAVRATAQRSASRQAGAREFHKQVAEHPEKIGRLGAGSGRAAAKAATTTATQKAIELMRKRKEEEEQRH